MFKGDEQLAAYDIFPPKKNGTYVRHIYWTVRWDKFSDIVFNI
jgi:hypothetical protein